jgi:hypothetical protein
MSGELCSMALNLRIAKCCACQDRIRPVQEPQNGLADRHGRRETRARRATSSAWRCVWVLAKIDAN